MITAGTVFAMYNALNAAGLEFAAFSCNGVNLFGDSKSIEELKRWHHEAGTVPELKDEIMRLRAAVSAGKGTE